MDHPTGRRSLPSNWVAWGLVLTAMLPTVIVIRLAWVVFDGSPGVYITQSQSEGMVLLGERWTNFWWASPAITTLQIAGLLPLLLMAVTVASSRPHALIPTTAARHAATAIAVTNTLLGLAGIAGFLTQFTGLMPVTSWPSFGSSGLDVFAPFAAVTFVQVALGLAATVVLWPQPAEEQGQESGEGSVTDSPVEESPDRADDGVGEEPTQDGAATPRTASERAKAAETVRARPGPPRPDTSPDLPAPSASDLDLYRRR